MAYETKTYVACDDYMHGVVLELEIWNDGDVFGTLHVTPMTGGWPRMALRHRLREAWRAFWSGTPYTESMFIETPEKLAELATAVNDALAEWHRVA